MGSDTNPKAAIHIEDLDGLNSVNILYQGSPKKWISIPANQAKYFEKRVAHAIGQSLDETIHMLRHKHLYMPKKFFEENQQLHYKEFLQHPGDMVIGQFKIKKLHYTTSIDGKYHCNNCLVF